MAVAAWAAVVSDKWFERSVSVAYAGCGSPAATWFERSVAASVATSAIAVCASVAAIVPTGENDMADASCASVVSDKWSEIAVVTATRAAASESSAPDTGRGRRTETPTACRRRAVRRGAGRPSSVHRTALPPRGQRAAASPCRTSSPRKRRRAVAGVPRIR